MESSEKNSALRLLPRRGVWGLRIVLRSFCPIGLNPNSIEVGRIPQASRPRLTSGVRLTNCGLEKVLSYEFEVCRSMERDQSALPTLTRVELYKEFLGKEHECQQIAAFLKDLLDGYGRSSAPQVRFLDAGCGLGRMQYETAVNLQWDVCGYEPDVDYFKESEKAAAALRELNPDIKLQVHQGGFTDVRGQECWDLVAAINGPFYYLLTPQHRLAVLRHIYGLLSPGGVIFLDMTNFVYLLHQLGPVGGARQPRANHFIFLTFHYCFQSGKRKRVSKGCMLREFSIFLSTGTTLCGRTRTISMSRTARALVG